MHPFAIVTIAILVVLVIALVVLYFLGNKMQKKQSEQEELMKANSQTLNILVIDKKKMKLKDAGLPQMVIDQTPKIMRGTKLPIVKVKVGPRIMNLIADSKIYDQILPKQELKANISGIYITSFKRVRGPVYEPAKKKGLLDRFKK
ncbi:MAG: hypothetical protein E7254_00455 [Lachnospiraceae bacterium]|nr:hypothetical protein [Lachnospiraceae bacterium]